MRYTLRTLMLVTLLFCIGAVIVRPYFDTRIVPKSFDSISKASGYWHETGGYLMWVNYRGPNCPPGSVNIVAQDEHDCRVEMVRWFEVHHIRRYECSLHVVGYLKDWSATKP